RTDRVPAAETVGRWKGNLSLRGLLPGRRIPSLDQQAERMRREDEQLLAIGREIRGPEAESPRPVRRAENDRVSVELSVEIVPFPSAQILGAGGEQLGGPRLVAVVQRLLRRGNRHVVCRLSFGRNRGNEPVLGLRLLLLRGRLGLFGERLR